METLSKQKVELKPQDEDMENEVEAIERKTPDDDESAKQKMIRDKASAILESWSQLQEVKFRIPKNEQRALHEREVEQAAAGKWPYLTGTPETSENNKIEMIYRNNHSMPWSYYEQVPPKSMSSGSRPNSPPNNMMMNNKLGVNRKQRQNRRTSRYVLIP